MNRNYDKSQYSCLKVAGSLPSAYAGSRIRCNGVLASPYFGFLLLLQLPSKFRYFELKLHLDVVGHWESKIVFCVFAFRKSTRGKLPSKLLLPVTRLSKPLDETTPRLLPIRSVKYKNKTRFKRLCKAMVYKG